MPPPIKPAVHAGNGQGAPGWRVLAILSALMGCAPMGWVIAVAGVGSFLCARLIAPKAAARRQTETPGACLATQPSR